MAVDSKKIHMIAVGGVGMSALAGLLKKSGHEVFGSDHQLYPPMSTLLSETGISCAIGYDPKNISPSADLVIIGNAVGRENPEVKATLAGGIPYLSMSEALHQFFLKEKRPLVVTGTHGKTTTAALLSWVLSFSGFDPSLMVGGWVNNFNSNHHLGKGDFFVVEGDEYDTAFFDKGPKFLHYAPQQAILTGIEFDHADIFSDLHAVKEAFRKFVRLLPAQGLLLAGVGDPAVMDVCRDAMCRLESYGLEAKADWQATSIQMREEWTQFSVSYRGSLLGTLQSPLIGTHNVKNSLAVIAMAHHLGGEWGRIVEGVRSFQGIKRRQEVIGRVNDILVIDDFAHHPTAVFETLAALRLRYPNYRVWAVFEPRSATSRRNIFQKEFVPAFDPADVVILTDIFAPGKIDRALSLDPQAVVSALQARGKQAFLIPSSDDIVDHLAERLQGKEVVCVMSSGGFDGIHRKLISRLKGETTHV